MKVPSNLRWRQGDMYSVDKMHLALEYPAAVNYAFLWSRTDQRYNFWKDYCHGLTTDKGAQARAVLTFMLQEIDMLPSLSYEELLKELL